MNKLTRHIFFLFFVWSTLVWHGLLAGHTIYVSGPPIKKNSNWHSRVWFKHSKLLYDTIKIEVENGGDTCELFPKRAYRDSVERGETISDTSKFYTKRELIEVFEDKESLVEELFMLIVKRHRELEDEFEEAEDEDDNKIRLMAHGSGGELLLMLKDSPYANLVRSYVVFDGDTSETESYSVEDDVDNTSDLIGLALRSDGNLVVNFDLSGILGTHECGKSGRKTEVVALVTALVGLIGGIIALL